MFLVIVPLIAVSATAEEWVPVRDISYPTGNLSFSCRWQGEDGISLKGSPKGSDSEILFKIGRKEARIDVVPEDAFPSAVKESIQCDLGWLPSASTNISVVLKVRPESWVFYFDNRLAVILPTPFMFPGVILQPAGQALDGDSRFQKTEDFVFEDKFLVPDDITNGLTVWHQESGEWSLHTAAQTSIERGDIKEGASKVPLSENSPNFYSLKGVGTNAVMTAGYAFYDSYILEAAVRVAPGEMGLVFYSAKDTGPYGFTVQMENDQPKVFCSLWKAEGTNAAVREVMGGALLDLTPEQWIRLKVVTYQNRVQCYVDNTEVMDVPISLPPGGRFGLFASSAAGVQFDDVSARTHHRLDLDMIGAIRRHTIAQNGQFFPRRLFHLFAARDTDRVLEAGKSREDQWLILGSTVHRKSVFSADFKASSPRFSAGIIAGYTGAQNPYYRFVMDRNSTNDVFAVEQVSGGNARRLEEAAFRIPAGQADTRQQASLMFDGSNGKELRFYRDGGLVMVYHVDKPLEGGSGLYVAPGTQTEISNLAYDSERKNIYHSRVEKNELFVEDPFMRHWSSPEGEWLTMTNGLTWNKSDFFGRFLVKMPFVPGSEVHLGVGEDGTNGVLVVRAEKDRLVLASEDASSGSVKEWAAAAKAKLTEEESSAALKNSKVKARVYSLHYEDHWLWATSGDEVLFKHPVETPFEGRRIRIAGFTTDQLKDSYVRRYMVKDYLFTDSPYEWRINGGDWSVVNRFSCTPTWSHMNGESADGLAALWTKYKYGGDFCMEMYAGMRHGWYERPGDLNMTIMASATSPSRGYTVTCTGWDPDHSQYYTRLYRNGREVAVSDKYFIPRVREGLLRKGYEPLVRSGRDVHGAWYYMKFRRIGSMLEYYFDNELAFAVDDDEPLNDGVAGLWTFMNSMMVARVKVAAERINPVQLHVDPVADPAKFTFASLAAPAPSDAGLLKDAVPAVACSPLTWRADDKAALTRLEWHRQNDRPYFSARNLLGSGNMFVRSLLPQRRISEIAGWQFGVKRTESAKFNFNFSIGKMVKGEYVADKYFFYRLAGDSFSGGKFTDVGESDVPGVAEGVPAWYEQGDWTDVTVWIPPSILHEVRNDTNILVKAEGFGIAQPSYELSGLRGNLPESGYAIRDFTEIGRRVPVFSCMTGHVFSVSAELIGNQQTNFADIASLQGWADGLQGAGLVSAALKIRGSNGTEAVKLSWINSAVVPEVVCRWSPVKADAIDIEMDGDYPDLDFSRAEVSIDGKSVPPSFNGMSELSVTIPREEQFSIERSETLQVRVTMNRKPQNFELAWKDNPLKSRPVLLDLKGGEGFFENFEGQTAGETLTINRVAVREAAVRERRRRPVARLHRADWNRHSEQDAIVRVVEDEQDGGRHIEVSNDGVSARLKSSFKIPISVSHYPLLSFRYCATGMVHVSASLGRNQDIRLSEDCGVAVPFSEPLKLDDKWHVWLGDISAAIAAETVGGDPFAIKMLQVKSLHAKDQTGLYSKWSLDDIAVGPAVSEPEQMAVSPVFFEYGGIESVRMSTVFGVAGFQDLSEAQRAGLKWKTIENGQEAIPEFGAAKDGIGHLLIQARGRNGLDSEVTDIPFMLDREAPVCSMALTETDDAACNGTMLKVTFKSSADLAPLDLAGMSLKCDDVVSDLNLKSPRTRIEQKGGSDFMYLNWPYIFRDQLNAATNQQVLDVELVGIADGAGNRSPDLSVPVKIDYAADHNPPSVLSLNMPSNILWRLNWKSEGDKTVPFRAVGGNDAVTVWPDNEEPYVVVTTAKKAAGSLSLDMSTTPWCVTNHPYLSFRIKQPLFRPSDTARVDLVVNFGSTNVIIGLTPGYEADGRIALPDTIAWNSGRWHRVSLNLPELLKEHVSDKILKTTPVRSIKFNISDGKEKMSLAVQSLCIYRGWGPQDEIGIDAYDASGMDGVSVVNEFDATEQEVAPLQLQAAGPRWITVRAKDKAGNVTRPYRFAVNE